MLIFLKRIYNANNKGQVSKISQINKKVVCFCIWNKFGHFIKFWNSSANSLQPSPNFFQQFIFSLKFPFRCNSLRPSELHFCCLPNTTWYLTLCFSYKIDYIQLLQRFASSMFEFRNNRQGQDHVYKLKVVKSKF